MRRIALIFLVLLAFTGCDKDIREVRHPLSEPVAAGPLQAEPAPYLVSR